MAFGIFPSAGSNNDATAVNSTGRYGRSQIYPSAEPFPSTPSISRNSGLYPSANPPQIDPSYRTPTTSSINFQNSVRRANGIAPLPDGSEGVNVIVGGGRAAGTTIVPGNANILSTSPPAARMPGEKPYNPTDRATIRQRYLGKPIFGADEFGKPNGQIVGYSGYPGTSVQDAVTQANQQADKDLARLASMFPSAEPPGATNGATTRPAPTTQPVAGDLQTAAPPTPSPVKNLYPSPDPTSSFGQVPLNPHAAPGANQLTDQQAREMWRNVVQQSGVDPSYLAGIGRNGVNPNDATFNNLRSQFAQTVGRYGVSPATADRTLGNWMENNTLHQFDFVQPGDPGRIQQPMPYATVHPNPMAGTGGIVNMPNGTQQVVSATGQAVGAPMAGGTRMYPTIEPPTPNGPQPGYTPLMNHASPSVAANPQAQQRSIVRTGVSNGQRVAQYSDGSIETLP